MVSPLMLRDALLLLRRPDAVVLVGDPDRPAPPRSVLREMFGLTEAQSALAALVGAGNSVDAVADGLGITCGTARWTLKQIFLRTGTTRQADLVRLLDSVPSESSTEDDR